MGFAVVSESGLNYVLRFYEVCIYSDNTHTHTYIYGMVVEGFVC